MPESVAVIFETRLLLLKMWSSRICNLSSIKRRTNNSENRLNQRKCTFLHTEMSHSYTEMSYIKIVHSYIEIATYSFTEMSHLHRNVAFLHIECNSLILKIHIFTYSYK